MTPQTLLREAVLADVPLLVSMMTDFYSDSPYTLNPRRAINAFSALLSDERLGHIWFVQSGGKEVGYIVLTLCFGMTYGGLRAVVDDFYIEKSFRGLGLGKRALAEVKSYCLENGVRSMHVETGRDNSAALAVYRRAGFKETDPV